MGFGPQSFRFLQVYSFSAMLLTVILFIVFLGLLVNQVVKEVRNKYVDFITISQYILLSIYLILNIINAVFILFDYFKMIYFLNATISTSMEAYLYLNFYQWVLMIYHIKQSNQVIDGGDFKSINKKIMRVEVISSLMLTITFVAILVLRIIYWDDYGQRDWYRIKQLGIIIDLSTLVVFIVAYPAIYLILVRILKANLNVYSDNKSGGYCG